MRYQDNINHLYFENEFTNKKYLKQYIVMKVYNKRLLGWKQASSSIIGFDEKKPTLSEVWNEVNAYFQSLDATYHTCKEPVKVGSWVKEYRELGYTID